VLGHRANVLTEEVVQLHAAANSQMAEWAHRRYVDECGAVAALERVTKAAAAAGEPLAQDLRLEVGGEGLLLAAEKLDFSTCQQGHEQHPAVDLHGYSGDACELFDMLNHAYHLLQRDYVCVCFVG
jgi:hypothetical protein